MRETENNFSVYDCLSFEVDWSRITARYFLFLKVFIRYIQNKTFLALLYLRQVYNSELSKVFWIKYYHVDNGISGFEWSEYFKSSHHSDSQQREKSNLTRADSTWGNRRKVRKIRNNFHNMEKRKLIWFRPHTDANIQFFTWENDLTYSASIHYSSSVFEFLNLRANEREEKINLLKISFRAWEFSLPYFPTVYILRIVKNITKNRDSLKVDNMKCDVDEKCDALT